MLDENKRFKKGLSAYLKKLPFVIKVASASNPGGVLGEEGELAGDTEEEFNMSLINSLGNVFTPRLCVVIHWKSMETCTYSNPLVNVHEKSESEVRSVEREQSKRQGEGINGSISLHTCMSEYFKEQTLNPEEHFWMCPECEAVREGKQEMTLSKCPDILIIHLKRFNCSERWKSKIRTKVDFPLLGFDVAEFVEEEASLDKGGSTIYDCCGVINHLGGIHGGHYVALCKATRCTSDGVENTFVEGNLGDGGGTWVEPLEIDVEEEDKKEEGDARVEEAENCDESDDAPEQGGKAASSGGGGGGWLRKKMSKAEEKEKEEREEFARRQLEKDTKRRTREGGFWIAIDDENVEEVPRDYVVSEASYVLFYRKRFLTPMNVAEHGELKRGADMSRSSI